MPSIPNIDIDPPKYGPPNMADQLYKMIRGIPQAYQEGVENKYKTQALERADVTGKIQLEDLQDYQKNPPKFPTDIHGAGGDTGSARQGAYDGAVGMDPKLLKTSGPTVADIIKHDGGDASLAGDIAGVLGIDAGKPLSSDGVAAVRNILASHRQSAEEEDTATGAVPGPGANVGPDPRRNASPNVQPGVMGGPPNVMPSAPGFAPYAPGGAPPPGAAPPSAMAQAGGPYSTPLQPYVTQPPPVPPRAAAPNAPWTQARIDQQRSTADLLDDAAARPGLTAFPGRAAALKDKAKALREEAKQAQELLNKNRELTTEQKNAPPGMSPQQAAAYAETLKGQAAASMKNVAGRIEGIKPSQDAIQVLDEMKTAFKSGGKNISTGPGSEGFLKIKQAVNNWAGQDIFKGVRESEQIQKLNAFLAAAVAKSMTARPTQYEFKAFQAQNPGLATSKLGSGDLIDILRQTKMQELELGRMADKFKPGGDKSWSEVEQEYFDKHPIISPLTKKPIDAQQAKDGKWYRPNPEQPDPSKPYHWRAEPG
jgi:hypothetical protein